METILLSNIPHYHYLAQALQGSGYLKRYITSVATGENGRIPGCLPQSWRKKLESRRLTEVPLDKVRRICGPELLQRAMAKAGVGEQGDYINNYMFDLLATRSVDTCDVLHFVSSVGLYAARKARRRGARIICDVRQEHPAFQTRILNEEHALWGIRARMTGASYESKVLAEFALADYLILPSDYAKQTFVEEGYDARRIFVLPYGVSSSHFRNAGNTGGKFRVLFVGQITFRKGVQYLLRAFAELKLPQAELVLIGPLDPAFAPVLERSNCPYQYLGPLPKMDLYRHYSSASVLVLPSLADAFPLVIPEAMACGLPVVISRNTGSREVVRDGEQGYVVPIRDSEAIREKLLYLYEHSDHRAEMGRAAAACASRMTWERYGEGAVSIYRGIQVGAAQEAAARC